MLGYEDHGILTYFLYLDYGGSGQAFGGYALDEFARDEERKWSGRIPTSICGKSIKEILNVVGVEKWEDLKGKHIRVQAEHSKVHKIGHFLEDKWFDPTSPL